MNNKEVFIRQFNNAFESRNIDAIVSMVTDNISWTVVGDRTVKGKYEFKAFLNGMNSNKMKFDIFSIITHGNEASCDGEIHIEGKPKYAFCDVYKLSGFKNPLITSFRSYIIKIE